MPFINEKVSDQDIEKYSLREINKQFIKGDISYYWTIDRDRNIYLRDMGCNWQEPSEVKISFFWKKHLLRFNLRILESSGERGGKGSQTWGLTSETDRTTIWIPAELEEYRSEITCDLKDALIAYKGSGVFSTLTEYAAHFEF